MPDAPELDEFESLVVDAIDRLSDEFQEVLANVAVVVSTVTRWSVTSATTVICLPARSSRLYVTSLLTTLAGMREEREA